MIDNEQLMEQASLEVEVPASIFRAYDIRGVYQETLTPEIIYQIGLSLGSEAQSRGIDTIVAAQDGRISSPMLAMALQKGILDSGCNVVDIGRVPTPLLYFATHITDYNSGVIVTGSHNPANYNGLKIVLGGTSVAESGIKALYDRIVKGDFLSGYGKLQSVDITDQYIDAVCRNVKISKPITAVIDCGNGIAGNIAPKLYRQLGVKVIELFCDVDGNFPNHDPDPSQPKNVQQLIKRVEIEKADIGLMFDGDADRLGVVTNRGEIIWPDRQMILFSQHVLAANKGKQIIFDIKCSRHLANAIKAAGGEPIMWKTGHSIIKNKMKQLKAPLAGEMSGHIFFNDRWFGFDDGMYAGARLLEILAHSDDDVDKVFKALPNSVNTPELKIDIADEHKFAFIEKFIAAAKFADAKIIKIDGARVEFNNGWGLLRASNTTPCLTLRFEADDRDALQTIQHKFKDQLLALDESLLIPF